ncbi:uncharacterized protein KY384_000064 [Bacidia gigantensis]|uniref:uncharacterized protein n=1 Tax=Bacidia gigantensis TaxID=2732470 RepID=UPI001D054057|nr:uncharacterized protein KY384_000064 [Bacidia gigantensis]KAG8526072.1 hypothetical protein KY384_000064 [Bacidia gigantensis]
MDAQNTAALSRTLDAGNAAGQPKTRLLRLYLVRHGETAWSLTGQHTGLADIPLTAKGEDEARALISLLRDIPFDSILVSPRQRAQRTRALALPDSAATIEPDLAEWDYGDYEGRITADILREQPHWDLFRDGSPRGESPAQAFRKVIYRWLDTQNGPADKLVRYQQQITLRKLGSKEQQAAEPDDPAAYHFYLRGESACHELIKACLIYGIK